MNQKSIVLLLLMALLSPSVMRAQSTLTVYENANRNNEYVPFYGYYADEVQRDQMIYPASELSPMVGKEIRQMVFYIYKTKLTGNIGDWIVSLGETDATTLDDLDTSTPLTVVYSGPMSFDDNNTMMTVTFSDGYVYGGNNLLVEFYHPDPAAIKRYWFYGNQVSGASYSYDGQRNFLPKVTFTYQAAGCPRPQDVEVNDITFFDATVNWTGSHDSYIVRVGQEDVALNADFETNDFTQAEFTTTTDYPWTVVENSHSGIYCAKSSNEGMPSTTSDLVLEVDYATETTISFSAKVSSEHLNDKAYFSVDGTNEINAISGNGVWMDYSFTLSAGPHTLRWYYTKGPSINSYDDCFYVDDIRISGGVALWDEYPTSATTYLLNGLATGTPYMVEVVGLCGSEPSTPSDPVSFVTPEICPTPTSFICTGTTATTATLTWHENGEATAWQICLNDDETNLIDVDENPYTLTGLTPEMAYAARVRANCGEEQSAWSPVCRFTPGDIVIIGENEENSGSVPTDTYIKYSLTQQILTAQELGDAGTILSIGFYSTATERTRNLDIYMASTDKSSFTDVNDWAGVTANDLVYSGPVTFVQNDWTIITLDNGFVYDGTGNVVLVVDDNTGSFMQHPSFAVFTTAVAQTIQYASDVNNYNPMTPGVANSITNKKNYIRISKSDLPSSPLPVTQTIALADGVNWVSFNVEITLDDLKAALVEALPGEVIRIRSKIFLATYNGFSWRGTLNSLDVSQMYIIEVNTDTVISLEGMPVDPAEHPITIGNGGNWIGYPLRESMTPAAAFAGFAVRGDKIKTKSTMSTYNGSSWRGSLTTLEPGQGYIYESNATEDRVFVFPTNAAKSTQP